MPSLPLAPEQAQRATEPSAGDLRADAVACWRGGRRLFSGLQLQVSRGEAVWLRGPNGCGKTSLLRLLGGLVRPESGEIRFEGQLAHQLEPGRRARLRFLGHANALKDTLPVADALGFRHDGSANQLALRATEA